MTRKQWYRLHKWLAVGSGIVLLMWCGTGVVMVIHHLSPRISGLPTSQSVGAFEPIDSLLVSPARAASIAADPLDGRAPTQMDLRPLGTRVVYRLRSPGGNTAMVDARSGSLVRVDSALAVALVRQRYDLGGDVTSFRTIRSNDSRYPFGTLPGLQMRLADGGRATFTVGVSSGEVFRSSPTSRLRTFMGAAHSFGQLRPLIGEAGTYWSLTLIGTLTILAGLTGFWIAWPRTWWPARSRNRAPLSSREDSDP